MSNVIRARAEAKPVPYNATQQERDQAFRVLLTIFKRRCNDYGIMKSCKEHESFESKPRKDRRKRKEAALRRQKDEMAMVRPWKLKSTTKDVKYHKD